MNIKYTEEEINRLLDDCLALLASDVDILLKGELSTKIGFSEDCFGRWASDNANNEKISQKLKLIDSILKDRIVKPAIQGKHSSNFTAFFLKNAYPKDFKDKQEIEINDGRDILDAIRSLNKTKEE